MDDHVGKIYAGFDVEEMGCSPLFRCHLPATADPKELAARMQEKIREAIKNTIPADIEWSGNDEPTVCVRFAEIVLPEPERSKKIQAKWDAMRGTPEEQAAEEREHQAREAAIDSDSHNGTVGWWHVSDMRHNCIVRTDSKRKALSNVELPYADAQWIGETMPDVFDVD